MSRQDAPSRFNTLAMVGHELDALSTAVAAMRRALEVDTHAALDDALTGAQAAWEDASGLYALRRDEKGEESREPDDFDAMDEYRRAQRGW